MEHWRNAQGGGRGDPFVRSQVFYKPADPWLEELRHFARLSAAKHNRLVRSTTAPARWRRRWRSRSRRRPGRR
jgi:hypothetical protein